MSAICFSIIIPTAGRATLARTLESIMNAGYSREDEVIVVGDGPQPDARKIVDEFSGRIRINYVESAPTPGQYGDPQRNTGIPLAKGSHVLFQDDDDCYLPGSFHTIRDVAAKNPGKILMFRMQVAAGSKDPARHKHWGPIRWIDYKIPCYGNVSTQMFVIPNVPGQFGVWQLGPNGEIGDYTFLTDTLRRWPGGADSIVWREEVICDRY